MGLHYVEDANTVITHTLILLESLKLLIWEAAVIGQAPNLCLHRRQQKERLCHVCAEKLGHEKATSFPPLRGRIHRPAIVSTPQKLLGHCNQIYKPSGEAAEQLIAETPLLYVGRFSHNKKNIVRATLWKYTATC